jgi:hypothetical protein
MSAPVRAWFACSLALLLSASLLHLGVLAGIGDAWAAMVHLSVFGWITAMICAVNYHTMPVFAARDFPAPALLWWHLAALVGGLTLASSGLLASVPWALVLGLGAELLAALLFAANVVLLFVRGARRPPAAPQPTPGQRAVDKLASQATASAGICLPLSLLLMLLTRLGLAEGAWWLASEHLAVLGWVLLMIVGVAEHVLPRFSGKALRGARWVRLQLRAHQLALVLLVPALGLGWMPLFAAAALLMAAALALFAWNVWPTLTALRPQQLIQVGSLEERR